MLTKKAHGKKRKGRVLVFILSLFLIFGTVSSAFAADNTWTTDPDTSSSYSGAFTSTADAGKVWTDKSVTDNGNGIAEVKLSALSESRAVAGESSAPVDAVFVLDFSGSMNDSFIAGKTRAQAMVEAANSAINKLIATNSESRIGVVGFNKTAFTVLAFNKYTVSQGSNLLSYTTSSGKRYINGKEITGGTNIQAGINAGSAILENSDNPVGRVPMLLLLSDGSPTFSNSSAEWWNNNTSGTQGPGNNVYYGNGFLAALSASYNKIQISNHYNTSSKIYTIGMIGSLAGNELDLANVTINPRGYLSATNTMATEFRSAFANYTNGTAFSVQVDQGWWSSENYDFRNTATQTQAKNILSEPTSLIYNDAYYPGNDIDDLLTAFEDIVTNITKEAGIKPIADNENIVFTDQIGEYVDVKSDLTLSYDGTEYTMISNGNGTYQMGTGVPAEISGVTASINTVASGNQTLTWTVPANAIPLIKAVIQTDTDGNLDRTKSSVTQAVPISLSFNVGLQDGIDSSNIPSGMTADSQGYYNFYTNSWTTDGALTTAEFSPVSPTGTSTGNTYYYFSQDTPLYTDSNCTTVLTGTPAAGTVYYYKESAYAISGTTLSEAADVILSGSWSEVPVSGITNGVAAKGTLKPTESTVNKAPNNTETSDYSSSAAVTAAGQATTKLGNNGRLQLKNTNATLAITGTKNILGGDWTDGQSFTFNLEQVDENGAATTDPNVVLPDSTSVTTVKPESGSSQTFEFGNITFKAIGTYYFKVSETDPGIDGMTNAEAQIITVNVTKDDSTGILTATSTSSSALIFNNVYKHSLTVEKSVPGESGDKTKAFSMTILLEGPTGDTVDVAASGTGIEDNKLTFTKQTDGTYKATVALADTQSVTLTGLDPRWKFSVAEDTYDGYTTTYKLDNVAYTSGTSTEVASADHTVVVTNDRGIIVISGIEINKKDALYASIAVLTLAVGGSFYFISRKKARG